MDEQRLRVLIGPYAAVDCVTSTGTTNADLAAAATAGAPDRTVLFADRQTAGQGRRSRSWVSPAGAGVYVSVLLRPTTVPPARLSWLTPLAGIALVRTARWAGADAVLKWPNDLLLGPDRRKGAGVLAEVVDGAVVLGIGVNVGRLPDDVPPGPGGLPATSLAEAAGRDLDPTDVAIRLLTELDGLETAWRQADGDPDAGGARAEYVSYCATVGQAVRVELVGGTLTGVATGIGLDGTLAVRTEDGVDHAVSAGDVVHLRALP
jgi:BirA family biotin operon repressor/biotin-[acetyl-CoA-carboxylase] ligase